MWRYDGSNRPDFAETPKDNQESVWDYPRPPSIQWIDAEIKVVFEEKLLGKANRAIRISETASPPVFYMSFDDVNFTLLVKATGSSFCEWKGIASYWKLSGEGEAPVAWSYENPVPFYGDLKNCLAFYPGRVNCFLRGEKVLAQPGGFYGGWLTSHICGPVKGLPGTESW